MDVLKFGFRYWKKYLGGAITTQIMSFAAMGADLLLPLLMSMFVDYVIRSNEPADDNIFSFLLSGKYGEVHTMTLFWHLAVVFIGLLLVRLLLVYTKNVWNQKLGLGLETDLRMDTFQKLMDLDSATISEYNTGELLTTINSDTIMYKEMFCRIIPNILDNSFGLITAIVLLALINPFLLIIPVLLIPVFVYALRSFKRRARMNYRDIRACNSDMNLTVQENIEAVRLVRSFTNEEREKEKFDTSNDSLRESYIKQVNLSANFEAAFSTIRQIAYIGGIAVSAVLVMKGQMRLGYLVACTEYVMRIMNYITTMNNMMFQMQQQVVSGYKMMHFMEDHSRIPDGDEAVDKNKKPHIEFSHATMKLQNKKVLDDITLDIPYGKKVGIVGGTGSGKSTLLESLIRIHDMSDGEVKINGKNIRRYDLKSLRDQFAYVFQDVFLFSNTIESNIAYAKDEMVDGNIEERKEVPQEVITAAKHAQADDFIKKLPDGYETIVGERGLGISGGQKQRVSIARALLKNAPVLILDDSTSALDVETEKKLLADIKKNYNDKTLIISAHRMTSVVDCDEILYLLDGAIAERGTFDELMALDGHFANVYRTQQAQRESVVDFGNSDEEMEAAR